MVTEIPPASKVRMSCPNNLFAGLSLDIANGYEAGDAFGEAGAFGGVDDVVDVFVGGAGFFGEAGETDAADIDAAGFHVLFQFLAACLWFLNVRNQK